MGSRAAIGLLLVLLVAGALRFYQLRQQSIFIDEDLYTVAVLKLDSFSPRSIGRMAAQVVKPPLPLLSQAVLTRATGDALLAGRVLSAGAGLSTTWLTYVLGRRLTGGRASAGVLAGLVYALSPVAVLHERLVLQDGLLTSAALAAVLVGWTAVERGSLGRAVVAAGLGCLAVQMKLPGVAVAAAPVLILLANRPATRPRALAAAIAAAGPIVGYLGLELSPLGPFLSVQDEARFAPFTSLGANGDALWDAAATYFPAAIGGLMALGIVWLASRPPLAGRGLRVAGAPGRLQLLVVLGMPIVWIGPWVFISNFAPSRYYLPAVPYLAGLAGVGAAWLIDPASRRPRITTIAAGVAVFGALASLAALGSGIAVDRASARLSRLDDWQYRTGWPAGAEYARAARLVASLNDSDGRVYMINQQHLLAAGAFDAGLAPAWVIEPQAELPPDARGALIVMIDNVRLDADGTLIEQAPAQYLTQLRLAASSPHVLDFFARSDSDFGVAVVRIRLPDPAAALVPQR